MPGYRLGANQQAEQPGFAGAFMENEKNIGPRIYRRGQQRIGSKIQ